MTMLIIVLIGWVLSPFVLVPLWLVTLSKKKKLELFTRRLLDEKRITYTEYKCRTSSRKLTFSDEMPEPRYGSMSPAAATSSPQPVGTFVGPPLPPDMLQKRREQNSAAAALAVPDAVRDVSLMIAETKTPAVELTKPAVEAVAEAAPEQSEIVQPSTEAVAEAAPEQAETVQPATEAVAEAAPEQTELVQPATEAVAEVAPEQTELVQSATEAVAEAAPEQTELVQPATEVVTEVKPEQPAAGIFGNFIGPPLPPEILAQRRAMSAAASTVRPSGAFAGKAPQPIRPQPVPEKKHTINPASAMLIIGSALVVIAGMIFSTAKWNDMTDWQRTGVIALMSAFFFGLSAVAHKKLRLENTGMAFYMLGSVFTSITFVTVGYFGLFGNWMSVKGGGVWLLYSLAALLVTVFSAGAVKIYRKGAFVHAALYGGLCSFTLMSVQLFDGSPDMWALFLNLVAAVPIFLLYKQKLRFGSDMYDDHLKLFTVIIAAIYAVAALPYMAANIDGQWTIPCFLTMLVWFAQAVAYGILLDNRLLKNIHPLLAALTLAELSLSLHAENGTKLLVFGILIFAAAAVYRYVRQIRTGLSDVLFAGMLFCSFFTADKAAHQGGQLAVCMGLLVGVFIMHSAVKEKTDISRAYTTFMPFAVLVADYGLTDFIVLNTVSGDAINFFIFASIAFVAALVFDFVKPIRTILSDAVFPISMLVCYSVCASAYIGRGETLMTAGVSVMLLVSVLIHAFEDPEKRMVKQYAYALPVAALVFAQGAAVTVNGFLDVLEQELALTFGCTVFLCAIAMRFVPRLRTRFSDILNVAAVAVSAVVCHNESCNSSGAWFTAGLTAAVVILIGLQCFGRDRSDLVACFFRGDMPLAAVWFSAELANAIVRTADIPDYRTRVQLGGLIFALVCFAAAFVFMNVEKIKSFVSAIAFPVSLLCGGLYLCSGAEGAGSVLLGTVGFALMAVVMLIQNGEKGLVYDALRFFHWAPFVCVSGSLSLAISLKAAEGAKSVTILWAGLFVVLFGLMFRFSGKTGANIRTVLSDIVFTVLACVLTLATLDGKALCGLFVSAAAAVLILANIVEKKPKHSWFVLGSRWLFPCVMIFFSAAAAGAVSDATAHVNLLYDTEGELVPHLVFILLMFAVSVVFLKIRKIRTLFSDFLIPAAFAVICIKELSGIRTDILIASLIAMTVLSVMLLLYGLEKDGERHLIVHRVFAPLALFVAADGLAALLWSREICGGLENAIAFLAAALVAAAASAEFTALAKKTEEKRFAQSQYTWAAVTGLMLFPAVTRCEAGTMPLVLGILCTLLGAAVYLLCGRQKRNYLGVLPAAAMLTGCDSLAYQLGFAAKDGLAGTEYGGYTVLVMAVLFIMLCGLSRLVSNENVLIRGEKRITVDFAAFAMIAAPIVTCSLSAEGNGISPAWCRFIAVLELGLFFLNLIRKGHARKTNLVMLTLAAAAGCSLIYVRPFLLTDNVMLSAKIDLIPLILFSILVRLIWKEEKKLASDISFLVQLAAFAVLLFDALTHQSLANTIIVLCVTLTIMLVSFAMKSGRWFAISSASFLGLTIYITRGFVGRVEWWVYLLTAGLVLIAVASVNEYMKSRGQTLKDAVRHFLSRWKKQ